MRKHDVPPWGAIGVGLTLLLAGCQGGNTQNPGTANATLVVGASDLPAGLDKDLFTDPHEWDILQQVYDPIFRYGTVAVAGQTGVFQESFTTKEPFLASNIQLGPNNTSLTITLKHGVKSCAGNELTAADMNWTIDRALATKAIGLFEMNTMRVTSPNAAKVLDKYTIQITPVGPAPLLLDVLGNSYVGPFDSTEVMKHATATDPWATDWVKTHTAGFGPYCLDKWIPGDRMELTANPNYWRGKATITRIIYKQVPSSSSRVQLLQAGQIDIAEDLAPTELDSLQTSTGVKVVNVQSFNLSLPIILNYTRPPFNNPLVGQALNWATPQDQIVQTVYKGKYAKPWKSCVVTVDIGYTDKYYIYHYDPSHAKQLLAQAGYPNGFTTTLTFNNGQPGMDEIARIIKDSWGQAGVNVILDSESPATYTVKQQRPSKLDMSMSRDLALLGDALYAATIELASGPGGVVNYGVYKNDRMDQILDESLGVADPQQRLQLADEMQKIAVLDFPARVYLVEPGIQYGVRDRVASLRVSFLSSFDIYDIKLQ